VPSDGRVIEVVVDVVVDATGHVLEELGHTVAKDSSKSFRQIILIENQIQKINISKSKPPAAGLAPGPGGIVEHLTVTHNAHEGA